MTNCLTLFAMACKRGFRKEILKLMNDPSVTKLFETSVGEVHVIEVLTTLQSVAHRRVVKKASNAESDLKEKLKRTTRRLVAARKEWNDTRKKLVKLNGKLAEAAKELSKLGNDLKLSMESHERERHRDTALITSLLEQLTTATTKQESTDLRLRCALEEQLEMKNEIRNLKENLEEKDIRVYSEALEEAENKAKEYKRDKENLQSEVDRLTEEIEMANIIIDEWETEYNESEVELEIAKEEINELKARIDELQYELKVLRASERGQQVENVGKINGQRCVIV